MKQIIFKGSGVAIVTPMNLDGSINFNELGRLIDFQIENGTDAIIACGTTGESATLNEQEHNDVVKYTVEKVNKRVPVIAGTGCNNTAHALKLSQTAEKLGADALLIVTPYYNKTSQAGLVKHYTHIADNVNLPIILYNVPSRTGCNIAPETYLELSKHPRIVATKEASGDISSVVKIRALCKDNLEVYSGNDDQTVPILSLGGLGVISVMANICPGASHDIVKKYMDGNIQESAQLMIDYSELMDALFSDVNPIPVKEALNLMGYSCGECRMPLTSMNPTKLEKLKEILKKYQLI